MEEENADNYRSHLCFFIFVLGLPVLGIEWLSQNLINMRRYQPTSDCAVGTALCIFFGGGSSDC